MPICPRCGKYHKRSHHRIHLRTCVGWNNPALDHWLKSRGLGAKDYTGRQEQLKKRRLEEIYSTI